MRDVPQLRRDRGVIEDATGDCAGDHENEQQRREIGTRGDDWGEREEGVPASDWIESEIVVVNVAI